MDFSNESRVLHRCSAQIQIPPYSQAPLSGYCDRKRRSLSNFKNYRAFAMAGTVGVKHVCLYDKEGILKKSKDFILENLDGAILFQDAHENNVLLDQQHMTLEFVSFSDGKEAVAKAANVLFMKYSKSGVTDQNQKEKIFTESQMSEALKTVGSGGPEPDLLLVYGPARCHLGFPAWRIKYTEIVHMGPLKSMNYGSLIKAIYKFTMVRQNYDGQVK
ncbi:hypothetical protein GOBAR_DD17489 [Gossypium barbadense]|nr:hypothetical protein GOBAR_DD17489 [Gossypium barbadense]